MEGNYTHRLPGIRVKQTGECHLVNVELRWDATV